MPDNTKPRLKTSAYELLHGTQVASLELLIKTGKDITWYAPPAGVFSDSSVKRFGVGQFAYFHTLKIPHMWNGWSLLYTKYINDAYAANAWQIIGEKFYTEQEAIYAAECIHRKLWTTGITICLNTTEELNTKYKAENERLHSIVNKFGILTNKTP